MAKYAAVFSLLFGLLACQLIMFRNHYLTFIQWSQVLGSFPGCTALRICLPVQEMQEKQFQSLGRKDCMEEETATHSSILAWKISWTEQPGRLQPMGSQRVWQLSMHSRTQALECFTKYIQSKSKSNYSSSSN